MNNSDKKNSGLPEIAQEFNKNKTVLLIMIVIVALVFIGMAVRNKNNQAIKVSNSEIYTVQNDNQEVIKKSEQNEPVLPEENKPLKEVAQSNPEMSSEQIAYIQQSQNALQQRLSAPLMLVNSNFSDKKNEAVTQEPTKSTDANTQFMNQLSAQGVQQGSTATSIGALNSIIAEGSFIHAILESAANSDLPGYLRASVSEPVYSEDGSQILIPIGSRLIGQYKSGVQQGQSRFFIVWTRVITPNGFSINLGSPGVDSLGVAGISADEINRHFWQRFGTASLLSIISAGTSNMNVSAHDSQNSAALYREAVADSFSQSANQSLQQDAMISPTLIKYQGKPIMVFVAKDLHFAEAVQQAKPKVNVL